MCASRVMCCAGRNVKGTGETNELTASRRELRAKNTLVTLPPLRGRQETNELTASRRELRASPHKLALHAVNCALRIGDAGAICASHAICCAGRNAICPRTRYACGAICLRRDMPRGTPCPCAARRIPSRSRSEHIECEFTSIYRTRVYERISNRAERDISSRAQCDLLRILCDFDATPTSSLDILRSAWDRAIRYVLRTRYAASGSICRAGRDEKKTKTPAPKGAGETGDRISR